MRLLESRESPSPCSQRSEQDATTSVEWRTPVALQLRTSIVRTIIIARAATIFRLFALVAAELRSSVVRSISIVVTTTVSGERTVANAAQGIVQQFPLRRFTGS